MNIVEKLGITPGPLNYKDDGHGEGFIIDNKCETISRCWCSLEDGNLYAVAPEMLEGLIVDWETIECFLAVEADSIQTEWYKLLVERQGEIRDIIEKACYPKKWNEIKELSK